MNVRFEAGPITSRYFYMLLLNYVGTQCDNKCRMRAFIRSLRFLESRECLRLAFLIVNQHNMSHEYQICIICVLLAITQSNSNDTTVEFNCTNGTNSSNKNNAIQPSSLGVSSEIFDKLTIIVQLFYTNVSCSNFCIFSIQSVEKRRNRPNLTTSCNTSADCNDLRMTCSKNSLCQCST